MSKTHNKIDMVCNLIEVTIKIQRTPFIKQNFLLLVITIFIVRARFSTQCRANLMELCPTKIFQTFNHNNKNNNSNNITSLKFSVQINHTTEKNPITEYLSHICTNKIASKQRYHLKEPKIKHSNSSNSISSRNILGQK